MTEKQRLVLLFGCGGDRDKTKRPLMGSIASHMADFVIVTADNSRSERTSDILSDIMAGFDGSASHTVIENRKEAITFAISSALPGDVILLCGKGHEEYEIMPDGTHPFSEREIVQAAAARHLRSKGFY
jgi:UDP-N-acetylmuramoyl-L-alanyl-D-glutamate--2,6-diaminopimelate ligase